MIFHLTSSVSLGQIFMKLSKASYSWYKEIPPKGSSQTPYSRFFFLRLSKVLQFLSKKKSINPILSDFKTRKACINCQKKTLSSLDLESVSVCLLSFPVSLPSTHLSHPCEGANLESRQ